MKKPILNLYINTTPCCGIMAGYALVVAESPHEAGVIYDFVRREEYEHDPMLNSTQSYEEFREYADKNADTSKEENWECLISNVPTTKAILRDEWHYT